jgi:hypothetical protein
MFFNGFASRDEYQGIFGLISPTHWTAAELATDYSA